MEVIKINKSIELPINYELSHWSVRRQAREEYVRLQDGKCWFCKESLGSEPARKVRTKPINPKLFPETFFDHQIHLHHNHKTGMTVGAVHSLCNAFLWQYYGE